MNSNGKTDDPAPHALDIHHEELSGLIDRVTLEVQSGVRELREELDNIMRAISERQDGTQTVVQQYVNDARAVHSVVKVIREHAEELKGKLKIIEVAALTDKKGPTKALPPVPPEQFEEALAKFIPKGRPTRDPQTP